MSRTIEAEYLAEGNVLKLAELLAGVRDHEKVRVTIDESVPADDLRAIRASRVASAARCFG